MQQDSPTKTSISSASAAAAAAARTQTTHRQVGAGPQPPPEPLCQHSLGQCTNLRYPGHTVCARHLATTAPYTQSDQASLNQTPLQFCQYQTNSNAQSIRCGEVVERPKRFCHQHEPDPLPEPSLGLPAQLGPDAALQELLNSVSSLQNKPPEKYCFADAFQISKFVRAKVSEPNPHRVRDRMSECASDTDSSLSDDPSDSEESTFPSTAEVFTRTEVVRAARCKLQALKTAYEDEVLRLQRELRQGYEKFVSSGGASAVGGSSASSSAPGGVASSTASSSSRRSAYEQCQVLTGTDKWLRHRATERRYYAAYIEQMKPPSTRRCSYSGPPSKCYERALPLSSYCLNHVLSEPNQCLFRACTQAGCTKPVIRFESSGRCDLHRGAEHYELPDDLLQSALDSANKVAKP
uniref:KAT8 regulatory NSL complex subunit 2 n=2 Tax=Macrostomum lignano TaxID=282301 RepID=A0A1I8IB61_9PLAT